MLRARSMSGRPGRRRRGRLRPRRSRTKVISATASRAWWRTCRAVVPLAMLLRLDPLPVDPLVALCLETDPQGQVPARSPGEVAVWNRGSDPSWR